MATDIIIPDSILKRLNNLPKEIRNKFWEQLEKLLSNPTYPSLRHEKLEGTNQLAFSITMNYRATYMKGSKSVIITAIGTHKEVLGK